MRSVGQAVRGEAARYAMDHEDGTKRGSRLQRRSDSEGPVQKPGQRQRVDDEDCDRDITEI